MRFPGAGGASDAAVYAGRVITFMKQERRRFVKKLDYYSTPGFPENEAARLKLGLTVPKDSLVVTDKAVFRFREPIGRMYLWGCYPGVDPEDVVKEVGFFLDADQSRELPRPSAAELDLLRKKIDPIGLIIKKEPRS